MHYCLNLCLISYYSTFTCADNLYNQLWGIPDFFADRPKKWTNKPWLRPLQTTIFLILKRLSLAILSILTSVDLGK